MLTDVCIQLKQEQKGTSSVLRFQAHTFKDRIRSLLDLCKSSLGEERPKLSVCFQHKSSNRISRFGSGTFHFQGFGYSINGKLAYNSDVPPGPLL